MRLPLLACLAPAPLLVLIADNPDAWTAAASRRGWEVAVVRETGAIDAALAGRPVDPLRTYLAGPSSTVFSAVSRRPDLWAAAVAAGPLQVTDRLFGANAQLVPLLWISAPGDRAMRESLTEAGFQLLPQAEATPASAVEWLAGHTRDAYPAKIDCESADPDLPRCYWLEATRLDFARRNDALPSSLVAPASFASLSVGPFGFHSDGPGPGVAVESLPPGYKGPLKPGDRILSLGGAAIEDARQFLKMMEAAREDRTTGLIVQRGKERLRIETRIVAPKREKVRTARVQAEYIADRREVWIVSRGVAALRLRLPAHWTPAAIQWNGAAHGAADAAGCWAVTEGLAAARCE